MEETNPFSRGAVAVKDEILNLANIVASDGSVGFVVLLIGFAFFVCSLVYLLQTQNEKRAISILYREITKTKTRAEFAERYSDLEQIFESIVSRPRFNPYQWYVKRAWDEYFETLVPPIDEPDGAPVRNTVRPNFFFNSHDLGFEHGIWRHLPGIFVSVGLLLTFLGIIAAINQLSGSFDDAAMARFLGAAKSKFIMSLSGLTASILFTLLYRVQSSIIERKITYLCDAIEYRVLFHTPEQIAADQLKELREQSAELKTLGNDLGAQIGSAVSDTLTRDLAPVLDKVGNSAGTEVSGMVGQIGDALNAKLNESLDEMSRTLSSINRSLVEVSERLATSGGSIGAEMSKGMAGLNSAIEDARRQFEADQAAAQKARDDDLESSRKAISVLLEAIESNTRDNSAKMKEAAAGISEAVASLTTSISDAGQKAGERANSMISDIGADMNRQVLETGTDMTRQLSEVSEGFFASLSGFQEKIDTSLVEPIRTMARHLETSNVELEKHAAVIARSNTALESSAGALSTSSKNLENVARPRSESIERSERINTAIRTSLEGCLNMMDASRKSVDQSMQTMKTAIEELEDIVGAADEIDEKLGGAFQEITKGLTDSQDQIRRFSEEVTSRFGEGIQKIQQVLDGISEFQPSGRGG